MNWFAFCGVLFSAQQAMCEEFSRCYDDVNICLWTDGSMRTQYDAERACQQRNNSFLPRITNSKVQSRLADFRSDAGLLLNGNGFWIGVEAGIRSSSFHWIDKLKSDLRDDGVVHDQTEQDEYHRFAVIVYDIWKIDPANFVYSARHWEDSSISSYICQLQQQGASCADGDLSMNSKCYRKFDRQLSWYNASNDCLSRGGSLAVFIDIGRPSDNSQLTKWLNASGTNMTYWIGLIRTWWENMDKDGNTTDVQYSNWEDIDVTTGRTCVVMARDNYWRTYDCSQQQRYVCQNYSATSSLPNATTPAAPPTTTTTSSRVTTATETAVSSSTSQTPTLSPGLSFSVNSSAAAAATHKNNSRPSSTMTTTLFTTSNLPASSTSGESDVRGAVIGLAVGVSCCILIALVIIIALVCCCICARKRKSQQPGSGYVKPNPYTEGQQPPYAALELDQRNSTHHNGHLTHGPASDDCPADFSSESPEDLHDYDDVRLNSCRVNVRQSDIDDDYLKPCC